MMPNLRKSLWLWLILAAEALLFLWKCGHFFNGDSLFFFSHRIQNPAEILTLFKGPDHLWQYRPLTFLIFSYVLYPLFGTNPLWYNIFPLLAHAANTLLAFGILRSLGLADRAALLGTFFFGTHLTAFYVTYGVAFLPDFSYSFFYLLSIFLFLKFLRAETWTCLVLSLLCFVLALFCKEAAVTLPVVIAAIAFFAGEDGFQTQGQASIPVYGAFAKTLPFVTVGAVYLGFHWIVKAGQIYATGIDHPHTFEFSLHTFQYKYKYLKWALNLPDGLVFKFEGLTNYVVALLVLVFMVPFVLWTIRRLWALDRLAWCGILWFAAALSPVLLLRNLTMHHNLYVPLVGLALLFGSWLDGMMDHLAGQGRERWARLAVPAFVLFSMVAVFHHNLNAVKHSWIAEASTIAETSLRDLKRQRPELPDGAVIYIVNKSSLESLQWYYDYGSLIRVFYPAKSLDVRFIGRDEALPDEIEMKPRVVVLQYDGSHLTELRGRI